MKKTLIKKGFRELKKYKIQYIFLIIILGLGVGMYSALYDLGDSREATLSVIYDESNFMDLQIKTLYGSHLNLTTAQKILNRQEINEKIAAKEYRLTFDVFINHSSRGDIKTTKGIVIGYQAFTNTSQFRKPLVNTPLYFVDDPAEFKEKNAKQCYLEHKFSKVYGLEKGDSITIIKGSNKTKLDILEQASVPEYFFVIPEGSLFPSERSLGVIIISLESAQEMLLGNIGNEIIINDIVLTLKNLDDLKEFRNNITNEFKNIGIAVKTIAKYENPAYSFLWDDYESDKESISIFPIVIFTVTAIALIMVLRRMIRVHRSQIGVFKALGIPDRVILSYFGFIGLFIAIFGIITGLILAIPINTSLGGLVNELYDFPIMKLATNYEYYIYSSVFSIILCLSCTLLPTWWALQIKPIDAIQTKEGVSLKKIGRFTGSVGKMSKLPVALKLTLRNILRKPGRSATSIIGIALSLALFLSFAILMDTVLVAINRSNEETVWDYEIAIDGFQPVNITRSWVSDFSEVEKVNHGIILPTKISKNKHTEDGIIYALENFKTAYKIKLNSGKVSQGNIIISSYISKKLGVDTGDIINLELPKFDPKKGFSIELIPIKISGIQTNHIGYYLFMDLSTMQDLTKLNDSFNIVYLSTQNGKPSQKLENYLITQPGVISVLHHNDLENVLDQYFELFVGTVFLIALISIGLSAAIVYNLFMISTQEKRRDYATMKTLGTSLRKIGYIIFIEAGFIVVFGLILGVAFAYVLAFGMLMNASEFEVWNFEIIFSWNWFMVGTGLILFVVYFVSYLTIRYIKNINIADVIRERNY